MKKNFENLDKVITKLNNSSLTVIAGRPNSGKSNLVFNIAVNVVQKERVAILDLSLEIEGLDELNKVIKIIRTVDSVYEVRRKNDKKA